MEWDQEGSWSDGQKLLSYEHTNTKHNSLPLCVSTSTENAEKEKEEKAVPEVKEEEPEVEEEKLKTKSKKDKKHTHEGFELWNELEIQRIKFMVRSPLLQYNNEHAGNGALRCWFIFISAGLLFVAENAVLLLSSQNYLSRNFYNFRFLALFIAFALNFILLFYKVRAPVTNVRGHTASNSAWSFKSSC